MKLGVDDEGDFKFHKIYYSQKKKIMKEPCPFVVSLKQLTATWIQQNCQVIVITSVIWSAVTWIEPCVESQLLPSVGADPFTFL